MTNRPNMNFPGNCEIQSSEVEVVPDTNTIRPSFRLGLSSGRNRGTGVSNPKI
jgi:hypothetical protein